MTEERSVIYAWDPMIRMSDMKYPVYFSDFRREHPNVSMGDFVWEEDMGTYYQYFLVRDSEKPMGDVVTEGQPVKNTEDDRWYKTWTARDFTAEEVAENLSRAKEDCRIRAYQQYTLDLQDGVKVDGSIFSVEPRELANLRASRDFAVKNPNQTVRVRRSDYTILSFDSSSAVAKIEEILSSAGEVNQILLEYLDRVYSAELITDIPPLPSTFLKEE